VSVNFDEVLANGTEEEIEAAIAEMEIAGDDLFSPEDANDDLPVQVDEVPAQEKAVEPEVIDETPSTENNVAEEVVKPVEAAPESLPAEEEKPSNVIEQDGKIFVEVSKDNAELDSKNGKHKLPFALMEGVRSENSTLKGQLEEQQRINAELKTGFDESKRVAELHSKQLSDAGLDPKLLPEQMLKDPELMAQIKEDYPQIGELVSALASKLEQAAPEQQAPVETPVEASQDPAQEAFAQTSHLKEWMKGDADRWEMAKLIDGQLANNPSFENKTPSERFLEIEKRVMNAFGDELPATPVQQPTVEPVTPIQTKTPAPIPNTPTDLGHQGNDLSPNANLLEQDAGTMAASMEGMTEAAIEELLEGASNFL